MFKRIMQRIWLKSRISRKTIYVIFMATAVLAWYRYHRYCRTYTGSKFNVYQSLFGESLLPEPTQGEIDYFAENVQVQFTVEDNFASGEKMGGHGYYIAHLKLVNTGNIVISKTRWQLFGYFARLAEPYDYPYPNGFHIYSCGLKLYHIEGSLFKFEPSGSAFNEIKPLQSILCRIKLTAFQVSKTDSFPRWYVTGNIATPKIIANTNDESLSFVGDFINENQFKRRYDERIHPYTAQERYEIYNEGRREINTRIKVIPSPLKLEVVEDSDILFNANQWVIVKSDAFLAEIKYFSEQINMKIVKSQPRRKFIQISKADVVVNLNGTPAIYEEAYKLQAVPEQECILITAGTDHGVFNAFQTLRSILFAPEAGSSSAETMIAGFTITDAPRYSYRGLHLDVARNFIDVDEMLKLLDLMAMYKLNKLHLHLSDDEGWRLEIPGIPELTQIGASRCHDPREEQCILPMLGSGPFSNTSGSGYYAVEDYRTIILYAKERHIEIIPEFDMPGHSRAAIKSLHAKSQRAIRKDMKVDPYVIVDESEAATFSSPQSFLNNVMNPCMDSTYIFVRKVITAVKKLHEDIQPLSLYHFGGDEVADKAWDNSPLCKQLMLKNKGKMEEFVYIYSLYKSGTFGKHNISWRTKHEEKNFKVIKQNDATAVTIYIKTKYDLMKRFVNNLTKLAAEEGISVGAWEDGLLSHDKSDIGVPFPRDTFQNKDMYVYVWKNPSERRTPHRTKIFANNGYKVILAYGSFLYFDHPYEPDPEERGLYWATRKISTKDVWSFTQNVIFNDQDLDCPRQIMDKQECLQLLKPQNIVGIQAQLWTETVRTAEHVENMLLPRLLAVAERAWNQPMWENDQKGQASKIKNDDWSKFINAVGYHELLRLDQYGYSYRVPPPGAMFRSGKVFFNTEFPGLDVEYFSQQSKSWKLVSQNLVITEPVQIRTRSADGKRFSRVVTFDPTNNTAASITKPYSLILFQIVLLSLVSVLA